MIRVSIVEDDADYRRMLEALLNQSADLRCVSTYSDPREALRHLPEDAPDVVLMDLQLPGMNGIECIAALRAACPALQTIMLTVFEQDEQVFQALAAGACGYLVKRTPPARILEAIREVKQGGSPMSAHIARMVVASFRQSDTVPLSPQETEVLGRLSHGETYAGIAGEMGIAVHTVRNYIRRIYSKLHVHSRTEAVAKFLGQRR
jgi:DNA-binding NarL/FixJ family response regulator